jgi:hypothetical protein
MIVQEVLKNIHVVAIILIDKLEFV